MQITFFGVFWIAVLIIAALRGIDKLAECVIFSGIIQSGAIIIIKNIVISPVFFSCVFFDFIYLLLYGGKIKISKHITALLIFLLGAFLTSALSAALFRNQMYLPALDELVYVYYKGNIKINLFIKMLIYVVTAAIFGSIYPKVKLDVDMIFEKMIFSVFIVGVWQYASLMELFPKIDFLTKFVYSGCDVYDYIFYIRQVKYKIIFSELRFYSWFMEPSYCAGFLAACFVYYIIKDKLSKRDIAMLLMTIIMLFLTRSTTGYVACVLGAVLVMYYSGKMKRINNYMKKVIIIALSGVIFLSVFGLWKVLYEVVFNKMGTVSGNVRSAWNMDCLKVFMDTYMIGLGYGINHGSSYFYTLIGSTGIIGTALYFYFILCVFQKMGKGVGKNNNLIQVSVMFLTVIISQMIAIGIFEYSVFFSALFIYSYSISDGLYKKTDAQNSICEKKVNLCC